MSQPHVRTREPEILWHPDPDTPTNLGRFVEWLRVEEKFEGTTYEDVWRWSTQDVDGFWLAVWRFFDVRATVDTPSSVPGVALARRAMPGSVWFPQVRLNYAENVLRLPGRDGADEVVIGVSQSRREVRLTADELRDQVSRAAAGLRRLGVGRGDRVAAYAPNVPETLVLLLATAAVGAVFSSCAPEFGARAVIDRWRQIAPTVLLTVDGYRYGEKEVDRVEDATKIRTALTSVTAWVHLPYLDRDASPQQGDLTWAELLRDPGDSRVERVDFDHPLWVLFSSGTSGLPKPIVHGHGGMILEQLKATSLEMDLGPADVFFWFSTTGWTMWNILVSALLSGSSIVMFDGDPGYPDQTALWRMAERLSITYFGTGAAALMNARRSGLRPRDVADLSALRTVGSTGSPLPAEGYRWVYEAVGDDLVVASLSGGTDVCTGFVGSNRTLPVYAGRFSCRCLGAAVAAYDEQGRPVLDRVGELVVTEPMPTMPIGFYNDPNRSRYREAYFAHFPGVWRHGDWITLHADGTSVIAGRSDATLNRGGVRLGTGDFYTVVEAMPQIADSLVVHVEDEEPGLGRLLLFVVVAEGAVLDEALREQIRYEIRSQLSPRHLPDELIAITTVPRTLSGKKLEIPVKRILHGERPEDVASPQSLIDPGSLDAFVGLGVRP